MRRSFLAGLLASTSLHARYESDCPTFPQRMPDYETLSRCAGNVN